MTIYFDERHFCILVEARWNLLRGLLSSRLASRLRKIVFTTRVFTDEQLDFPVVVQEKEMCKGEPNTGEAHRRAAMVILSNMLGSAMVRGPPSSSLMMQVLQGIKGKALNAQIELDQIMGSARSECAIFWTTAYRI